MNTKKPIYLHFGDRPRKRATIDANCSAVIVPHLGVGGIQQITFMNSGIRAADGVEIWTRQTPNLQDASGPRLSVATSQH